MRKGQALQTLLASPGGEILLDMLMDQYHDAFDSLLSGKGDKDTNITKMRVIDKLIKSINGEINFGEVAKDRLNEHLHKRNLR